LPTHNEISTLLKTKIYLLEGAAIPPSLLKYIDHFTSENLARSLEQHGINVWRQVKEFPSILFDHLRQDQKLVYHRYQEALRELRHNRFF
jgi:hypothetical protein